MAQELEANGTAQNELATAQNVQAQPPNQTGATPAATTQLTAEDVAKEVQKVRSQVGRELAQARRDAELARQSAAQAQQTTRELQMRDMSDLERAIFERNEAVTYAQSVDQQTAAQRAEAERMNDLQEIATETGAPIEELLQATSLKNAYAIGLQYMKKQTPAAKQVEAEREEANAVYLGSGAPSTPITREQQRLQQLRDNRDTHGYVLAILNGSN